MSPPLDGEPLFMSLRYSVQWVWRELCLYVHNINWTDVQRNYWTLVIHPSLWEYLGLFFLITFPNIKNLEVWACSLLVFPCNPSLVISIHFQSFKWYTGGWILNHTDLFSAPESFYICLLNISTVIKQLHLKLCFQAPNSSPFPASHPI